MELLLMLTYAAVCVAIFKIFRIPVNKWTLPTAALGGLFLIGFILLVMNYNHPFTDNARVYFATTPIMPDVKGRVIEVPVTANATLKQGDILFRVDPAPYQFEVEKRRAALAEAEQNVAQLKAGYDSAQASVDEATAQRDRAKDSYGRYRQGNENARAGGRALPFSEAEVENRRTTYLAAESALQAAVAKAEQARVTYQSQIGGCIPRWRVFAPTSRMRSTIWSGPRSERLVRASSPSWRCDQGCTSFPHRCGRSWSSCTTTTGPWPRAFSKMPCNEFGPGDEAEVAFDAVPGRVFRGKVLRVLDAIASGQFQATGSLQDMGERLPGGRAVAVIEIDDDMSAYNIPGGAAAQVALYTPFWHHFAIIRRILLRMRSWENFVFLEGH